MAFFDYFRPKWRHSDPQVRIVAVRELQDPVKLVRVLTRDTDPSVRAAAIGNVENRAVLAAVARGDADLDVCRAALSKLSDDEELLEDLAEYGEHDAIKTAAADLLMARRLDPYLATLVSGDAAECAVAAEGLRTAEDPRVVSALIDFICRQWDEPAVATQARQTAVLALAEQADPAAIKRLLSLLDSLATSKGGFDAADALGLLAHLDLEATLAKIADRVEERPGRNLLGRRHIRKNGARALAVAVRQAVARGLDVSVIRPVLLNVTAPNGKTRPRRHPLGIGDADASVRQSMAEVLGAVGVDAPQLYEAMTGDESSDVRVAAAQALGEIGGEKAAAALTIAAASDDAALSLAAVEGLKRVEALLFERAQKAIDAALERGTPADELLRQSAGAGATYAVRLLLESGADRDAADDQGKTAAALARAAGHTALAELLEAIERRSDEPTVPLEGFARLFSGRTLTSGPDGTPRSYESQAFELPQAAGQHTDLAFGTATKAYFDQFAPNARVRIGLNYSLDGSTWRRHALAMDATLDDVQAHGSPATYVSDYSLEMLRRAHGDDEVRYVYVDVTVAGSDGADDPAAVAFGEHGMLFAPSWY